MNMGELRGAYHEAICSRVLSCASGAPNIADGDNARSVQLAEMIVARLGYPTCPKPLSGQRAGALFELETRSYLEKAFGLLQHLRPGNWVFTVSNVSEFDQYEHLKRLDEILREHPGLRATLGDYMVKPDILIGRLPVLDKEINREGAVLRGKVATLTPLRAHNSRDPRPILHASISCKWTIRSDRSQNARTEGLNLIRNRQGNTPHIVIVTAEPLPSRIASVALGTGDIDCVYHLALDELGESVREVNDPTLTEMHELLVTGKRLRDISDLPFDLAI